MTPDSEADDEEYVPRSVEELDEAVVDLEVSQAFWRIASALWIRSTRL